MRVGYSGLVSSALVLVMALGASVAGAQTAPGPGAPPAGAPPLPAGAGVGPMPGGVSPDQFKILKPLPGPTPGSRRPSADPRQLEGIYTAEMSTPFFLQGLPLTPKAAADDARDRQRMKEGKPTGGLAAICRPQPTFTLGSELFPGEILQAPQQVVFLNEEHRTRVIVYMDRDHPKDLKPTYFGDSVGRWEGDTLVIDSIGFNGRQATVSAQAHLVTRVRKIDGGSRLEVKTTYTDPVLFTAPVTRTSYSRWNPDVQMLEFQCEENLEGAKEGLDLSQ